MSGHSENVEDLTRLTWFSLSDSLLLFQLLGSHFMRTVSNFRGPHSKTPRHLFSPHIILSTLKYTIIHVKKQSLTFHIVQGKEHVDIL